MTSRSISSARVARGLRLLVVLALALTGRLAAEPPPTAPGQGMARYIMVLLPPDGADRGKGHSHAPEPNIAAIGGTVHYSRDEVITIPLPAVKQLRKHVPLVVVSSQPSSDSPIQTR